MNLILSFLMVDIFELVAKIFCDGPRMCVNTVFQMPSNIM